MWALYTLKVIKMGIDSTQLFRVIKDLHMICKLGHRYANHKSFLELETRIGSTRYFKEDRKEHVTHT